MLTNNTVFSLLFPRQDPEEIKSIGFNVEEYSSVFQHAGGFSEVKAKRGLFGLLIFQLCLFLVCDNYKHAVFRIEVFPGNSQHILFCH